MHKLTSREFKKTEFQPVYEFVVKKLNVPDLFKVRDRFEGNQFLINTMRKYMLFYTILNYINLDFRNKFKIGFINTINLDLFFGVSIKIIETKECLNSYSINSDYLFVVVNVERRLCEIYGTPGHKIHIVDCVSKSLRNFGKIVLL